jgi:biopolymer transport protein ExbD
MAATHQDTDEGTISGINVTPLVDITLVLLIVFMVTAKLITNQGQSLALPKAAVSDEVQLDFTLEIRADGDITLNGRHPASDAALIADARAALAKNPDQRAVVRADASVPHGRVVRAIDLLKTAGITKIAFGVSSAAPEPLIAAPAP